MCLRKKARELGACVPTVDSIYRNLSAGKCFFNFGLAPTLELMGNKNFSMDKGQLSAKTKGNIH